MIGTNTALHDKPTLNTRLWPGKNPVRIVIDKNLQLPSSSNLLLPDTGATIIFNHKKSEESNGIIYRKTDSSQALLPQVLQQLYRQNINSVLVEGGTKLLQSFIDAGLWDEASVITNEQLIIGEGIAAPVLKNESLIKTSKPGTDLIQYFKPHLTHLSH
jgi:diaminohydroxyphosphoribosylaminopyrimidine deaminase/5-amino-6-(5-phosphoribosylamino)uracil reductase